MIAKQLYQLPTIVHIPDIHCGDSSIANWPGTRGTGNDSFSIASNWIRDNANRYNIKGVLHTGDVVSPASGYPAATAGFSRIGEAVPYFLIPGNHDYRQPPAYYDRGDVGFTAAFPQESQPWIGGWRSSVPAEGWWSTLAIGGVTWLIVGLEWSPRDAAVTWANAVLQANPTLPAIVLCHAYLYRDGTRYDWATKGAAQQWNPHSYAVTPGEGIWDGQELWDGLIKGNNVRIVLCGHVLNAIGGTVIDDGGAIGTLTSTLTNGKTCHQILANFQTAPNSGGGTFRLLSFDYPSGVIYVRTFKTYGPMLELTESFNCFSLPLNL